MDQLSYKELQENFNSNNTGSTSLETFVAIIPCLLGGSLVTGIRSLFGITVTFEEHHTFRMFLMEYVCIILPTLLGFTLLSDHIFFVIVAMIIFWCSLLCYKSISIHKNLQDFIRTFQEKYYQDFISTKLTSKKRPYITNFRAFTNLMTVICILAVDFKIFPRRFAKTETFGFGLMDIGVGLYVVSHALVSRDTRPGNTPSISLRSLVINNLPLFVLGSVRLIITSLLGYQEHVTEYGTHWNFFFTLACTRVLCSFIIRFLNAVNVSYLSFSGILLIFYELVLNIGLRSWIFSDAPRLNFLSANREGIASIVGFISLHLCVLSFRKILIKRDELTGHSNIFLIYYLACLSCVLWIVTVLCANTLGVSRRLANAGYCLWVLAFTSTCMTFFVFCESISTLQNIIFSSRKILSINYPPVFCEAINFNGLAFFLLGNLLTGVINLIFRTLLLGPIESMCILLTYMLINCGIVTVLYHKNIAVKI